MSLTPEKLEAIRQRAEKAPIYDRIYLVKVSDNLAEDFYYHARQDIPDLLAEVERLRKVIEVIAKYTTCDDTWDYANRIINDQQPLDLPYRMGAERHD